MHKVVFETKIALKVHDALAVITHKFFVRTLSTIYNFFITLFSLITCVEVCLPWRNSPSGPLPHYRGFIITLRHTTLGRTPLYV